MQVDEIVRRLKRRVREYPVLLNVVQPPVIRATVAARQLRMAIWYRGRVRDAESTNAFIRTRIEEGVPSAVGKLGTLEGELLSQDSVRNRSGERPRVPSELRQQAFVNVGVFPATDSVLWAAFDELRAALASLDGLAVYGVRGERKLLGNCPQNVDLFELDSLNPWMSAAPWSAALVGKRVLVIHPFVETITAQYRQHRTGIWQGRGDVLPEFDLQSLRMPLSPGVVTPEDADWQARLARLRRAMDTREFDVALIGAGGMSLPLAVHAKNLGAVGIHLGGATQLLFGIRGRRWDESVDMQQFFNSNWTRPSAAETPESSSTIEEGCYW